MICFLIWVQRYEKKLNIGKKKTDFLPNIEINI